MAVGFYLDHNVDRAIADGLRRRGVDLLTAYEDGRHRADDPALINRATALGRVAVSSDRDFIVEAHHRQRNGIEFLMLSDTSVDKLELILDFDEELSRLLPPD